MRVGDPGVFWGWRLVVGIDDIEPDVVSKNLRYDSLGERSDLIWYVNDSYIGVPVVNYYYCQKWDIGGVHNH